MDKILTIQQAAAKLLAEHRKPLKSKDLARMAIEKMLVAPSMAKDPVQSLSQTLERNIRLNKGNKPKLVFVETTEGRAIALPEWYEERKEQVSVECEKIEIAFSEDLINKIKIYQTSFNLDGIEETVIQLVKKGLSATSKELIDRLKIELDGL